MTFTRPPAGAGPRGGANAIATIQRPDGVIMGLAFYDRRSAVPHDLGHLVAERELHMAKGFWGSIASGAEFRSMWVVSGRRRHDATVRSRAVLRANRSEIMLAELAAFVVSRAAAQGDDPSAVAGLDAVWRSVGSGPPPFDVGLAASAARRLRALGEEWKALPPGGELVVEWDVPVLPAPPLVRPRERGRSGARAPYRRGGTGR
ncbi:MAG: hypothetical protein IRZ08_12540 [Frankia sp.]|nr:hypothetical protein [Frankia sp.]